MQDTDLVKCTMYSNECGIGQKYGVFVGMSTLDIVYSVPSHPSPNSKNVATRQEIFAGGPAANAAVTFAHLSGESTLITAIGQHPLGSAISDDLTGLNVRVVDLIPEFEGMPTLSSIFVTENNGDRTIVSAGSVHLPVPPETFDMSSIDNASIVLVDGHHMRMCIAAAKYARQKGIRVVLDGGSWKPGMAELLDFVDTAICSENFLPPGCTDYRSIVEYLSRHLVSEMAITRGEKSILYTTRFEHGEVPVGAAQASDTLGAGDIFHGAFCWANTQVGFDFRKALAFAAETATRSCKYFGTRAWMASL